MKTQIYIRCGAIFFLLVSTVAMAGKGNTQNEALNNNTDNPSITASELSTPASNQDNYKPSLIITTSKICEQTPRPTWCPSVNKPTSK